MVNYYLDTSALLKHYVDELGSAWLRSKLASATSAASPQLCMVEAVSAFNRRVREGGLLPAEYQRVRDILYEDCRTTYQVVPATTTIVDLACSLLERHPLRGYDAMHLATALTVQQSLQSRNLPALTFLSADDGLNAAAAAEGLAVENPHEHS